MKKLKIAYFGTPYFSARFLERLLTDTTINRLIVVELVVTQPDSPVGRQQILTPSPVKIVAKKYDIEVCTINSNLKTKKFKNLENENSLKTENLQLKISDLDLAFLFAYGGIIPKNILNAPKHGFWNTHPSLLPKYRGPSPIAYPLLLGDKKTGVTLIQLDEKIDHGPIIVQEQLNIDPKSRRPDLEVKLTDLAFQLFKKTVGVFLQRSLSKHTLTFKPQNHSQATFTRLLTKDDGFLPLSILKKAINNKPITFAELPKIILEYLSKYNLVRNWKLEIGNSSKIVYNYFRGLYPWPGVWTIVDSKGQKKRLKITGLTISNPSTSLRTSQQLTIKRVQLEGKKEVDFETFNRAYSIF